MGRFNNFLNSSMYQHMANFAKEYIYLSEVYWELADEAALKSVDAFHKRVLMDKLNGDKDYPLVKKSREEINAYINQQKVGEYKKIPHEVAKPIKERIDKLIKSHSTYAAQFGLNIPTNGHLTTYQYYYNYMLLTKLLPTLELKAEVINKK